MGLSEYKYLVFFLVLFCMVPLGVLLASSSKFFEKVILFMMIFFTCRLEENIHFVSRELYRGTSRGYEVGLVDMVALVLFFVIMLKKDKRVSVKMFPPGSFIYFAYFFFSMTSVINAAEPLFCYFELWKMVRMYIYFWVLYNYFISYERIALAIHFLPIIIIYTFIVALYQKYVIHVYQIHGPLPHQNSLCMYMSILSTLMFAQLMNEKKASTAKSIFIFIMFAMGSLLVFFTLSRGGMVCYIGGCLAVLLLSYSSGFDMKKLVITAAIGFGAIIAVGLMINTVFNRFQNAPEASRITRYNLAVSAINMANDKFLGVGLNNFGIKVNKPYPYSKHYNKRYPAGFKEGLVETIYLMIAGETGWLNLGIFIIFIMYYYIMNFINIFRFANTEYQYFAIGLAGGLASIYVQSSLEWVLKQSPNFYQLMFCFAIIASMMTIYKREFAAKKLEEKAERQELARQKKLKKQQETELTREEERRVEDAAFAAARRRK
ncbi:MAG: O-antigen ligase family protein [Victivallaceae bacterium]